MTIHRLPEDLTINVDLNTNNKILSVLKSNTAIHKEVLNEVGVGLTETRAQSDKLPTFSIPVVDEKKMHVYVDNHQYWSINRASMEYQIKQALGRDNNLTYGALVYEWCFNTLGDYKAGMVYATEVFAHCLKTLISSSLRLDVATEFDLHVLCAFYHASLYHEKIDEDTLVKITTLVSGVCKTGFKLTEEILGRLAQNNDFNGIINAEWLASAIASLNNHSLRHFDYVTLASTVTNMYYKGEATIKLVGALEYPPLWWGLINEIGSLTSEKRTPIGGYVNGTKQSNLRDNFMMRINRITESHLNK